MADQLIKVIMGFEREDGTCYLQTLEGEEAQEWMADVNHCVFISTNGGFPMSRHDWVTEELGDD